MRTLEHYRSVREVREVMGHAVGDNTNYNTLLLLAGLIKVLQALSAPPLYFECYSMVKLPSTSPSQTQ